MNSFQDKELIIQSFWQRIIIAFIFTIICFTLLLTRLAYLQIVRFRDYMLLANENCISIVPIPPDRGKIIDRNGNVLAHNYSVYTLEIEPSKLDRSLNALISDIKHIIRIDNHDIIRFNRLRNDNRNLESLPIRYHLTDKEVAEFTAVRFLFPGVNVQGRLFRKYPYGKDTAHVVGYIGRLSQKDRLKLEENSEKNKLARTYDPRKNISNYRGTSHIGKTGIEASYEYQLHGITGYQQLETTAGGRLVRNLKRIAPVNGDNLRLSLDINLQQAAQKALDGYRGALVAIEPNSGEILAMASSPTFDPNLFSDGINQQNWDELNNSPDKPLLNRPLRGTYPPASTYKPFMALAGLTTGKRTQKWKFHDPGYFMLGDHRFRNVIRSGQGEIDMYRSIVLSNDTYYYMLAHELGVDTIHNFMQQFGFGSLTGIDLIGEKAGILPSTQWKKRAFKRANDQRWYNGETISLGIGQGYNSFTILQLAHATAILANGGKIFQPHLVKEIIPSLKKSTQLLEHQMIGRIKVNEADLRFIQNALIDVIRLGTAKQAFEGAPYQAAGKTGTAQVFSIAQNEKYQAKKIANHLRDHALLIAYAPSKNPKIALAVILENSGWGAAAASPVARKVLDAYLISRDNQKKTYKP